MPKTEAECKKDCEGVAINDTYRKYLGLSFSYLLYHSDPVRNTITYGGNLHTTEYATFLCSTNKNNVVSA